MTDLTRFLKAQQREYSTALFELTSGRKTSHWIWCIFPQLTDLGRSETAKFFGLEGADEAKEYLNHPVLGCRYFECCTALLSHSDKPVQTIMGSWIDAQKLKSSLTLMQMVDSSDVVEQCLLTFYAKERCVSTVRILQG